MTSKTAIVVYVKFPVPGKVKTRLAKDVGPEKAAQLYSAMIERVANFTLSPLPRTQFEILFHCDPIRTADEYKAHFARHGVGIEMQEGEDLGARLNHSISDVLTRFARVLTIGSDCLEITPALVEEAARSLEQGNDVVLGPATDGGYYLVGMQRPQPELFQGIEWSTDSVLRATIAKCKQLNLKVHLLAELSDIDTVKDLPAYLS